MVSLATFEPALAALPFLAVFLDALYLLAAWRWFDGYGSGWMRNTLILYGVLAGVLAGSALGGFMIDMYFSPVIIFIGALAVLSFGLAASQVSNAYVPSDAESYGRWRAASMRMLGAHLGLILAWFALVMLNPYVLI